MTKLSPWLLLACLAMTGCESALSPAGHADTPVAAASTAVTAEAAAVAAMRAEPVPAEPVASPAAPTSVTTKPFAFTGESAPAPTAMACDFGGLPLPAAAKVYAAGAYGGSKQDFQIDRSGHEATRMDVAVNQPDVPVALMLGSYEPTVWNIGWTPGTRILAVLVGGYHRQVITGLPANVPVLVSTHENRGACGYFYVTAEKAGTLNPIARRVFGRPVDMLYPAHNGQVAVGVPLAAGTALVTDGAAKSPSAFRLPDSQLAGPAGLEQAVRDGFLRQADSADAAAWQAAMRNRPGVAADAPPIAGGAPAARMPSMFRAYVVLKAYTLPAGLYGANSATFFVPIGVPRPTGERGHSTIYDFNTMGCAGVMCGRD
jgi:hypothetical protein